MSDLVVRLPWPNKVLSPNARVHWSTRAVAVKKAKQDAYVLANYALSRSDVILAAPLHVSIIFCPPDRRRRDWDNLIASLKPALDGISIAIKIDDSDFKLSMDLGEKVKKGEVIVKISSYGENHAN